MKRTLALLLALLMMTGMLAACKNEKDPQNNPDVPPTIRYEDAKPLAETLHNEKNFNYTYIHENAYGKSTIIRNGENVYIMDESEENTVKTVYIKDAEKSIFHLYLLDMTENSWAQYVVTPSQYQMNVQALLDEVEFQRKQLFPALENVSPNENGAYAVDLADNQSAIVFKQDDALVVQRESDSIRFSQVGTSVITLTDEMKNAPEKEYTHSQF